MSNTAHIVVRLPNSPAVPEATRECVIGRDLNIDVDALQDYCAVLLRNIEHDLVVLCGAVAYADRMIRRRRSSGWPRTLEVTLPVSSPEIWNDRKVYTPLVDVLEFVTGDYWHFHFVRGGARRSRSIEPEF